jgi:hypothetical protein
VRREKKQLEHEGGEYFFLSRCAKRRDGDEGPKQRCERDARDDQRREAKEIDQLRREGRRL